MMCIGVGDVARKLQALVHLMRSLDAGGDALVIGAGLPVAFLEVIAAGEEEGRGLIPAGDGEVLIIDVAAIGVGRGVVVDRVLG